VTDWDKLFDEWYLRTYAPLQSDEDAEEMALAAARFAGVEPGADVLDAPCGFGRHSIALARAGFHVTGADRSPVLLAEARRRGGGLDVDWVQADYRELPLPDASFDAVFNLFSSLGYVGPEGDVQALREFRRVLRPGGRLVIETMHRDRLVRIYQQRGWDELPGDGYLLQEREFDPVAGTVRTTMKIVTPQEQPSFTYEIRLYSTTELVAMARDAGFGEVECYGGFEREALTFESRLVLLAG
jgi:ubiquinone/menaquinone biosynthesis C-methylase UbiE